ncbi:MAG: hypothetical protein KI785_13400 [Devosiaceae bacterium]|nr:hypothetical protein [Devosiaceae bacterium MH13]
MVLKRQTDGKAFTRRQMLGLIAGASAAVCTLSATAHASEQLLSDPQHQLGLLGYDPVAFFADEGPRVGSAEHEVLYRGLVWRFVHPGNREAFEEDPRRFLPAYGGFDAMRAAEGVAAASDPRVFLVLGQRLFLFASPASRYAFLLDAERLIARADAQWPRVIRTLAP